MEGVCFQFFLHVIVLHSYFGGFIILFFENLKIISGIRIPTFAQWVKIEGSGGVRG